MQQFDNPSKVGKELMITLKKVIMSVVQGIVQKMKTKVEIDFNSIKLPVQNAVNKMVDLKLKK